MQGPSAREGLTDTTIDITLTITLPVASYQDGCKGKLPWACWLRRGSCTCRPVYNSKTKDVTARYEIYNGTDAALPASGGVANSALSTVASASTGKPS